MEAPLLPGAYRFYDAQKSVLYVGKAKVLQHRLKNHFQNAGESIRHSRMIRRTVFIDWIIVSDEIEALILEDVLIKKHHPYFNIRLRDDKRYPLIRLDVTSEFPTLSIVRRTAQDAALYYGPYTSAKSMRTVIRLIDKYFQLRKCTGSLKNKTGCLHFQMGRCKGVCLGNVSREEYAGTVAQVRMLLEGRSDALKDLLEKKMQKLADALNYEAAAEVRDQIKSVQRTAHQRHLRVPTQEDWDIWVADAACEPAIIEVMYIRNGFISGNRSITFNSPGNITSGEILRRGLVHYYSAGVPIPRQIILSSTPDDLPQIRLWLKHKKGKAVTISIPARGIKFRLLRIARLNLRYKTAQLTKEKIFTTAQLTELEKLPGMPHPVRRIEAIDISELAGKDVVGSVISFYDGKPEKSRYRKYVIKDEAAKDDLSRIREVFRRRLSRADQKGWELPDLFLIDGGKNQLQAALAEIPAGKYENLAVISIAKIRNQREAETIFLRSGAEITPDSDSALLLLLDRIRDEAHRFAITFHRKKRAESGLRSAFRNIPRLGPARRRALIARFGSITGIRQATPEELTEVKGIGPDLAKSILAALNSEK